LRQKRVTVDQKNEPIPKDLINDAEFVALMEAEMRDAQADTPPDELAQKRLWQRLETSTGTAATKPGRKLWPWAVAAALALGLLPLLQNQDQDQFKSGQESAPKTSTQLSVTADKDAFTISYTGVEAGFLALVEDKEPYEVLWLRNGPSGSWSVPKSELQTSRVCAITGQDITDITQKLNIIRELRQLPTDAPCLTFPEPSE
jgi:hypothetical protein